MRVRVKRPTESFTMVPNHVLRMGLSAEAVGVLCYFMSFAHGHELRVTHVMDYFRFGKAKWTRIANELREAGAITRIQLTLPSGKKAGTAYEVEWPPESENHRECEKPTVGKPDPLGCENPTLVGAKTRPLNKNKNKNKGDVSENRNPDDSVSLSKASFCSSGVIASVKVDRRWHNRPNNLEAPAYQSWAERMVGQGCEVQYV